MRTRRTVAMTAALGLALSASANLLIQVDEHGNGTFSGYFSGTLNWSTTISGGPTTLSYQLSPDLGDSFVEGEVVLYEDAAQTKVSDLLRFLGGRIFYYSEADATVGPADVGIPPLRSGVPVKYLVETVGPGGVGSGYWGYTPLPGDPGYNAFYDFAGGITYNFISDSTPVPEPSTFALGALLLLPFTGSMLQLARRKRVA